MSSIILSNFGNFSGQEKKVEFLDKILQKQIGTVAKYVSKRPKRLQTFTDAYPS